MEGENPTDKIAPGHKMYRISQEPTRNFSCSSSLGCSQSPSENYGSLVYQGTATSLVKGVKFFSLSTSLLTLGLLPVLFNHNGSLALNYIGGIFATIIFITPVLLHTISRTYVTRLYYNSKKDTYSAFTFTLFLRDRLTKFTPNDVQVPGITNLFTTFTVNGKALLVDPSAFSNPNDYNHLMGYDKHEQLNPEEIIKKIEESRKENQK
ncbi:transmembrane protein 70, mitochondrial-like [Glandiceps talaboti]